MGKNALTLMIEMFCFALLPSRRLHAIATKAIVSYPPHHGQHGRWGSGNGTEESAIGIGDLPLTSNVWAEWKGYLNNGVTGGRKSGKVVAKLDVVCIS